MLKRLLIANRGEIARRIIRTCRTLGVETVAVYSDADAKAPHVREADFAVRLGPPPARESYLDQAKVLAAAAETAADSIHPGYGFLSENAQFARAVEAAGLIWVGPPASAIDAMGLKDAAKALMTAAGVPVTPGYQGDDQSEARLQSEADRIGYPALIKAVAGGGGKGMRKVDAAADFSAALASCRREAAASFGEDRVLLERYLQRPRHIEVQVFADNFGNTVHLFERDCSLQRRHQKVIEEAPAPGMDETTRAAVTGAAVKAAQAVGYRGAGTIEFIADASEGLRADRIFFMEMNTRLQVEHPVTEMITGLDLVEWQLRVASGEPLPLRQEEIRMTGWAMEARLYAENPATGFLPSIGTLEHFRLPDDGVRIDSAVEEGGEVSPFYDPMIAKLIVHAESRTKAAEALSGACAEVEVWPVKTNAAFLVHCAEHPDFVEGYIDTGFIGARLDALVRDGSPTIEAKVAGIVLGAELAEIAGPYESPWCSDPDGIYGFRLNAPRRAFHSREIGGAVVRARATTRLAGDRSWQVETDHFSGTVSVNNSEVAVGGRTLSYRSRRDDQQWLFDRGDAWLVQPVEFSATAAGAAADGKLLAPMPGRIVSVATTAGARVAKGDPVVTLEAMKMEHAMVAPFDAVVAELSAAVGDQVSEGAVLARLEKAEG